MRCCTRKKNSFVDGTRGLQQHQVRPWVLSTDDSFFQTRCPKITSSLWFVFAAANAGSKPKAGWPSPVSSSGHLGGNLKGQPMVLVGQLNPLVFLLYSIFFFFNSFYSVLLCTVVCRQRVKAVGTQGKAQQHLDVCYSHFHGSSSTRENSAVLPFLPMDTCKQLLRTSNFEAKAPAFSNLSADWSREAIVLRLLDYVWISNNRRNKTVYVDMLIKYSFTSQGV